MKKRYYVIAAGDLWTVKEDGRQTPIAVYPQKDEAVKRGIAIARLNETELIIENGKGETEVLSFINQPAV